MAKLKNRKPLKKYQSGGDTNDPWGFPSSGLLNPFNYDITRGLMGTGTLDVMKPGQNFINFGDNPFGQQIGESSVKTANMFQGLFPTDPLPAGGDTYNKLQRQIAKEQDLVLKNGQWRSAKTGEKVYSSKEMNNLINLRETQENQRRERNRELAPLATPLIMLNELGEAQKTSYAQAQKESMYDVTKSPLSMESKGFFAKEGMRTPPVTEVYRMMGAHQGLPETSYKLAKTLDFKSAKQKDLNDLLEQVVMEEGGNVGYSNIQTFQNSGRVNWTTVPVENAFGINSTVGGSKDAFPWGWLDASEYRKRNTNDKYYYASELGPEATVTAKRGNNTKLPEAVDYAISSSTDTVLDQIPGFSIAKSVYDLVYEGKPYSALSEVLKVPGGPIVDFLTNVAQDNPSKYSIQKFEDEVVPYTRLASASMDNIAEKIGREVIKSRRGGPWHSPNYDLPSVLEAQTKFNKIYNSTPNEFVDFIKVNMVDNGKSYKQTLSDYEDYLKLTKKNLKAQQGGNVGYSNVQTFQNSGQVKKNNEDDSNSYLQDLEINVNKKLGYPMDRAFKASEANVENISIDNLRHSLSGLYTSQAIQNKFPTWTKNTGLPQLAGFLGSNILGAGHELMTLVEDERPLKQKAVESIEDVTNNFVGSVLSTLPFMSPDERENTLRKLSASNLLPDGFFQEDQDFYIKEQEKNLKSSLYKDRPKKGGNLPGVTITEKRPPSLLPEVVITAKRDNLPKLILNQQQGGNVGYSNIPKAQEGIWTTSSLDSAPTVNSTTVSNKEIDRIDRINKLAAQVIKKNPKDYTNEDLQILSESTIKDANKYIDRYKIERANAARKEGWSSPQKFAEATSAIGSRLSLQNTPVVGEYVPEILDVTRGIGEMASGLGRVPQNIQEGNYGQAALDVLTPTALGALAGVGSATTGQFVNNLVNPLAGTGEFLVTRTPLRDAYKINPWAFKANPEAYYRMIGETGFDDAMSSGLIRSKKMNMYPEPYFGKGKIPDGEYSNPKSTAFNPKTGERIPTRGYPGPYMVESKVPMKGVGAWADEIDPIIATPSETVNAFDPRFTFYKQDWIRGYKALDKEDLILDRQQGGNVTSAINEIENLQKIQNNMYNNNQRISRLAMMLGGGLIRGYQEGGVQQPMSPEEEQMMMEQAMQQEMAMQQGQQQPMPQQGGGMEGQPQQGQPQPQPGENKYMQLPPEQQVEVYKQIIDFVMENGIDTLEQQYPEEYQFFEEFSDMLEGDDIEEEGGEEMGGEMETEAGRMEMGGGEEMYGPQEEMEQEYPTDEQEVPVGARPGENAMRPAQEMKEGGIPQRYRNMGYNKVGQKRQSDRPGKKWSVLAKKGDKYKIVHGGAVGMDDFKQHGNKERQKRFWDRMGGRDSAKANDPFSPLYWHKRFGTW